MISGVSILFSEDTPVSLMTLSANDVTEEIEDQVGLFKEFLNALPQKAFNLGVRVVFALIALFIGYWLIRIIRTILKHSMIKAGAEKGVILFADSVLKSILYVLLLFLIAGNFGIDAASIVALLGSAGVAIGLAIQGSLSNFVSGFVLMLLKPYKVGDYISESISGNEGTVTSINTFYTTLITLEGKTVVIPNATLSNASLINFSKAGFRRVEALIPIRYDEDFEKTKEILINAVRSDDRIYTERGITVFMDELAESCVNLKVYAYCSSEDYLKVKWDFLALLKKALDDEGIEVPYPQLDVHVNNHDR